MFTNTEEQLETIKEIFETAKREDKWNLDEPMLYTFYWVDESVEKLEKLGLHLEKEGYDFIDIFELGEEETNEPTGEYLLHIDKETVYTPETLAAQNVEFQKLAEQFEIETYDGWEFGEVGDEDDEEDEEE